MNTVRPRARPTKILILSAGSLLGQNILDAIEPRRWQLRVVGADASAENARLFRCDAAYLVPPLDQPARFRRRFEEIIAREKPDIVFPGRDHDVLFLAAYRARHPRARFAIPCGTLRAARIMQDKAQSHAFCRAHKLPFADSLLLTAGIREATVRKWINTHAFPLLAKPVEGYGSLGIRLLTTPAQWRGLPRNGTFVLQEFIGPVPNLEPVTNWRQRGAPFFFTIKEDQQFAGQAIIGPDGAVAGIFCGLSTMVLGRCEGARPVVNETMAELIRDCAAAFASIGWRGPLNVQLRRRPDGAFAIHEFNGRMSGSTSARRVLGFDEPALQIRAFLGRDLGSVTAPRGAGYVVRTLTDCFIPLEEVAKLRAKGQWQR